MRNDIDDDTMTYGPNLTRLDQGDGKHLTLDECPRDQLEKEVGKYLDYVLFSHIYIDFPHYLANNVSRRIFPHIIRDV